MGPSNGRRNSQNLLPGIRTLRHCFNSTFPFPIRSSHNSFTYLQTTFVLLSHPSPQSNHISTMNASPELGEQIPHRLPPQLPPVSKYNPGKGAVPKDAEVIRQHPPLYAGDYNPRRKAYHWERLKPNNREDERLRLALHYGEERRPRCDLCEKEDRACMSMLGKRFKTTGCAFCTRRHLPCSQANGVKNATSNVRRNPDDTVGGKYPQRQNGC